MVTGDKKGKYWNISLLSRILEMLLKTSIVRGKTMTKLVMYQVADEIAVGYMSENC